MELMEGCLDREKSNQSKLGPKLRPPVKRHPVLFSKINLIEKNLNEGRRLDP